MKKSPFRRRKHLLKQNNPYLDLRDQEVRTIDKQNHRESVEGAQEDKQKTREFSNQQMPPGDTRRNGGDSSARLSPADENDLKCGDASDRKTPEFSHLALDRGGSMLI